MSISATYEKYLAHFRETVTLDEFRKTDTAGLCALRHDVDNDLDLALEMAHLENKLGYKASYFILPGTSYWREDPRLLDKCLQLQDYGHEVGLHVNSLAEWWAGETDDPASALRDQLDLLRNAGIDVKGIAAHGDKRCYESNLSNYWCFQELRSDDPYKDENGRTAEGPYELDMRPRLIYPEGHIATRPDGEIFPLWSITMQSLGIEYHAWHTRFDQYFSDSAGGWKRSPDPIQSARGEERWQVLMHPEHWRGPKKYYFFLSSARSGSKWLSEVLSDATPLHTKHEYILNQPFHRGETVRKPTTDVWALEDNSEEITTRLTEAWEEFEGQPRDFAEVNVYLEGFAPQLRAAFPEAIFIQLKRDPALVVSSLMDRNWYDTPEDRAHPRLCISKPSKLTQFERVCYYVAQTNERLRWLCSSTLELEEVARDASVLASQLWLLGIPYHHRLGKEAFGRISNARKQILFPGRDVWTEHQWASMRAILSGAEHEPAIYPLDKVLTVSKSTKIWNTIKIIFSGRHSSENYQLDHKTSLMVLAKLASVNYDKKLKCLTIRPESGNHNALVSLAGSTWYQIKMSGLRKSGWQVYSGKYVRGEMTLEIPSDTNITIYAIHYDASGMAIYRKNLGILNQRHNFLQFAFGPHPNASSIDCFLYIPVKSEAKPFKLTQCNFEWIQP